MTPGFRDLLRRKAPKALELLQALDSMPPQERVRRLDEAEARALLADPPTLKPYPEEACRERDRLARMARDERRRCIEKGDHDAALLYRGRKEFAAWYRLVVVDLELIEQTMWGVGPRSETGRKLARMLFDLAENYTLMPAPWPRDRELSDGAPCTTPAYFKARAWRLAKVRPHALPPPRDDFFHREESPL